MGNNSYYINFIEDYRKDYNYFNESEEDLLYKIGNDLLAQRDYDGPEYRFLSWLIYRKIIENSKNINLPFSDINYSPIFQQDFIKRYCEINNKRYDIYAALLKFIIAFKTEFKIQNIVIDLLIGGSFADVSIPNPSDIDFIILIPQKVWTKLINDYNHNFIMMNKSFEFIIKDRINYDDSNKFIDVHILPENFTMDNFYAYNNLIMIMNEAKIKDKDDIKGELYVRYPNNSFSERKVLRITI